MRLPWGLIKDIGPAFLAGGEFSIIGCLSFEDRCRAVPTSLSSGAYNCGSVSLLEIVDPPDAFPDYSEESRRKIDINRKVLKESGVPFESERVDLLASEDQMLDVIGKLRARLRSTILILDITSLPKRYFCFFLKRFLLLPSVRNLVVTYTQPGYNGYTQEHLAEDPMTCDHLPGYAAPLPPKGDTLVVSVGFESLSLNSLLEIYRGQRRSKLLLSFPPNGTAARRQWNTIRNIVSGRVEDVLRNNVEAVAAWDAEEVYKTLERWNGDADGLTLAPFGPKPHSLGMALFAMKYDFGMYYTQPKAYHPAYSGGIGSTWIYVVKWDDIICFNRVSAGV